MKCHLCGTYLTETSGPIWEVGGRKFTQLRCIDQKCASIRVVNRCMIEIILPDEEIRAYRLLVPFNEKWYRIWGRKNIDAPDDTTIYSMDVGYPGAEGHEKHIVNLPRFYPLTMKDDLKVKSLEILSKFKNLVVFL